MARPRYKPIPPDQVIRELRKEFRRLETKEEPGPARAALLATFTRSAHAERQLNMAMHTAALCLEEDPDPPSLITSAYLPPDLDDPEDRINALIDLRDLGRYVDDDRLRVFVDERLHDEAKAWAASVTGSERKHRLRELEGLLDRAFADRLRDELEFL